MKKEGLAGQGESGRRKCRSGTCCEGENQKAKASDLPVAKLGNQGPRKRVTVALCECVKQRDA